MKRALIYDGECQFCVNCVDLLKRVSGDSIAYYPSSEFSKEHPEIPLANFEKAVQLIRENGTGASAAEAILETLTAFHPAAKWIHSWYSKSLIVRSILDAGYEFVATHRQLFTPLRQTCELPLHLNRKKSGGIESTINESALSK